MVDLLLFPGSGIGMDVYRERAQGTGQIIDNRPRRIGLARWAWVPIPLLLLAFIGIWLAGAPTPQGSPYFILVGNFFFTGLVSLMVAAMFGRGFLNHGAPGLLLFGCGAVVWGASGLFSIIAGLASPPGFDPNISITIHNICIWEASLCYLAGATLLLRWGSPIVSRSQSLIGAYALAAGVAGFTTLATFSGWIPIFFVQNEGGTQVRYFVLGTTIAMLLFTIRLLWTAAGPSRSAFIRWFTLSFLLLAVSYFALMFETVFVEMLGWVGLIAQYAGGTYMFMAALTAFHKGDNQLETLAQPRNVTRHPYILAIVSVLFATVLRMVFLQALGTQTAFVTFFPAVMLASLYGGIGAGIFAAFMSVAIVDYYWIEPVGFFTIGRTSDQISIAVFLVAGIMVSWIANRLRQDEAKLRVTEAARREELERLVAERTAELSSEVVIRRQAESTARESRATLSAALASMSDAVFISDKEGNLIESNHAFATYHRYPSKDECSKSFADCSKALDVWMADGMSALPEMWAIPRALRGESATNAEYTLRRKDTGETWVGSYSFAPICDVVGAIVGAVVVARDITERKQAEQALVSAKTEAERADLSKSKFLAAASHDLRQPVQSLALLLTVLEKHSANNPKIAKTADMMKMAVGSLTGMLSSILDISRLDAGAVTPAMKGIDVGEIVGRLTSEYALTAKNKGLKLRSVRRALGVWTDPDLLERALRNLIENALRYTKKGGILVGVRQRGERVRIDVVDTGIGIPADKKADIFEEFYQVNNPGRDGTQGMGLGLSIVARLVRLMGAEMQVTSQLGRGSRFSLLLPLHYGKDVIVMDQKSVALDDPGGRILLIEDNATLRQGLHVVLESWGYDVLTAVNGEEALDIAARLDWEVDAILADYRLGPGLTGIETAQEIERRTGKSIPTLVLTGDTAKERIAEILASGFAILHKPVNAEDLRQNLAKLLSAEDKVPLSQSLNR